MFHMFQNRMSSMEDIERIESLWDKIGGYRDSPFSSFYPIAICGILKVSNGDRK